jgi:Tfp pilus assembly protein PilO
MAKLNEKQKLLAIGGTAFAVCLMAGGGVYWANGLIAEVRQSIDQKNAAIAVADAKIAKIPATEKEVIILRENLDEYVKILPDTQALNDFVTTLNQFATTSGVTTQNFQPGKVAKTNSKVPEKFSRIEYEYDMTATLWQFLRFVNLIENYERFISITDYSIAQISGRDAEQRDGEQVHSVKLKMETYVYNAKGSGQDVQIPAYDTKRDALKEEIWRRIRTIEIEKYEHRGARGRRDIFVDPREREGRPDGPPVEEQKSVLERFIGDLLKVKELVAKRRRPDITIFDAYTLDKDIAESLDKIEIGAQEVASRQQITAPAMRVRWVKEVVEPLAELRTTVAVKDPRAPTDPFLSADELQQLITSMTKFAEEGDLESADQRYETVSQKIVVPESDPRHELAVAAKAMHIKVKTAIEFKNLELKIQGVLVNHEGGRSGLLVNGSVFEEGEYLSAELMLRRVEEEQVYFVFRGLTLIRTL